MTKRVIGKMDCELFEVKVKELYSLLNEFVGAVNSEINDEQRTHLNEVGRMVDNWLDETRALKDDKIRADYE